MSRQISELETILSHLIAEHRKLLTQVLAHHAAVKAIDVPRIGEVVGQQEATRARITVLENSRRDAIRLIAAGARISGELTIGRLAELFPAQGPMLLKLRGELRGLIEQITHANWMAGRVAGAVLAHLNGALRLLSGAAERAGVYTRTGSPRLSPRIGGMEAVG